MRESEGGRWKGGKVGRGREGEREDGEREGRWEEGGKVGGREGGRRGREDGREGGMKGGRGGKEREGRKGRAVQFQLISGSQTQPSHSKTIFSARNSTCIQVAEQSTN